VKARLLGGIAALVIAITGTVLLITYVQSADARAMAGTETAEVFVVQTAIAAGTPVGEIGASVAKKPLPKSTITSDSVTDLADLGDKVTAVSLVPGEQLLSSRLVEPASFLGPSRVAVPEGMQEISLKLPIERVVGGKIAAGDTVGVFISLTETNGSGENATQSAGTQLTFHKVLVTAAQPMPPRKANPTAPLAPVKARATEPTSSPLPGIPWRPSDWFTPPSLAGSIFPRNPAKLPRATPA
jgi:pilus assembly protein CpaB